MSASNPPNELWQHDALDRKPYAEFLTNFLKGKVKDPITQKNRPFCMALDASWGEGKTFFVTNWAKQVKTKNHCSFLFDAWAADYQADPTVAFMAAFINALNEETKNLAASAQIKRQIKEKINQGLRKARSAIIPLGKLLIQGVIKKATTLGWEEISEAIEEGEFNTSEVNLAQLSKETTNELKKEMDKYFNEQIKQQANKEALFQEFREKITEALLLIEQHSGRTAPFFVFIDEIDRCRPSFALELLEGIKHIFNIPGLCFILSTNITQLSHAVGAIYGAKFDGRSYLQRFFDCTYHLPKSQEIDFIEHTINTHNFPPNLYSGLPATLITTKGAKEGSPALAFQWIFGSFDLDLRTQKKVIEMTEAVAINLAAQTNQTIHILWIGILSAAYLSKIPIFELLSKKIISQEEFETQWKNYLPHDQLITHENYARGQNGSEIKIYRTKLMEVAYEYHRTSNLPLHQVIKETDLGNTSYPGIIKRWLQNASSLSRQSDLTPTTTYIDLVKYAGHTQ